MKCIHKVFGILFLLFKLYVILLDKLRINKNVPCVTKEVGTDASAAAPVAAILRPMLFDSLPSLPIWVNFALVFLGDGTG